jgi:hypothetical protein
MFGCGKGAGPGPSRELFMEASHSYGSYGQGYGALGISCPFVDVHWMTLGSSFRDGIYSFHSSVCSQTKKRVNFQKAMKMAKSFACCQADHGFSSFRPFRLTTFHILQIKQI